MLEPNIVQAEMAKLALLKMQMPDAAWFPGDSPRVAIDAQCEVLRRRMNNEQVAVTWNNNGYYLCRASEASAWLDGLGKAPSELWAERTVS